MNRKTLATTRPAVPYSIQIPELASETARSGSSLAATKLWHKIPPRVVAPRYVAAERAFKALTPVR
jgi:hypothetical protein